MPAGFGFEISFQGWRIVAVLARWTFCNDLVIRRQGSQFQSMLYGGHNGGDPAGERARATRLYAGLSEAAIQKFSNKYESNLSWYEAVHLSSRAYPDLAPPGPKPDSLDYEGTCRYRMERRNLFLVAYLLEEGSSYL